MHINNKYNEQIINLYHQGSTARSTARDLKISVTSILRHYKKLGIKPISVYKNCNQEIINLSNQGLTARKIAKKLGVSHTLVLRRYKELGIPPLTLSEARKTHSGPNKGKKMSEEFCKKVGDFWRGKTQSPELTAKRSASMLIKASRGENHYLWKGGNSRKTERNSRQYRTWRRLSLNRDGHKCVICESNFRLEVDHIKPWISFPDLRYNINNGRTLCRKCHKQTPTYGIKLIRNNQKNIAL